MEEIISATTPPERLLRLRKILGASVLSKRGSVIGRVASIRLHPKRLMVEGIVVKRGMFKAPLYIDRTHFDQLSEESIILTIDPSVLLKGRRVITFDGEVLGRVKKVNRLAKTNRITSLVVKPLIWKEFVVEVGSVHSLGVSIILKESYHVPKRRFWKSRSK